MDYFKVLCRCSQRDTGVSSQIMHFLTSPVAFVPFWTGSFMVVEYEEDGPFPAPPPRSPDLTPLDSLFRGFCNRHGLS